MPLGSCPTVGLGGLALGGGYGLAARAWGLTADNVTRITVVTPDGRLRRVDRRHDADLFWALRGGGGGNFGIATRFELRVAPRGTRRAGSAARCRAAPTRSRRGRRGRPRPTRGSPPLLQLGSNGSVDVLGQYLGSEAQLDACLGPLRRAGASLTTGTLGLRRRCRSAGRTGARRPRSTFSAKSHYVTRALPARAREALVAELARGAAGLARPCCSSTPTAAR